ncbi:MAG: DNA topoisomerase VI subunit B [Euryarchaeota archaeon]|nr:DNA topoisomerase VI subunit B [Euryarchaeota archaeon]NDB93736.1 DNA topoisomerase VI subunit B [Euryarchaeota archaeon]NDF22016.1 DNA topoisomerase VI subunit B [Euryarchaeota archaeon]NDF36677.1 DNA topoisomerase VI subunit B [Euryarchaeota archaeon]NDG21656.1 DNA topoisomerase VI subunit B [Euryarchaeota archaeon]
MDKAQRIANKQKQISISEFFEKNKHFLGFDTHQRAIITAVKEAVDNSLDACEEGRILPDIDVLIRRIEGGKLELVTQDNGPGIPRDSIANVFGKFLLGSRFHAIRQTRGQQGIGITGVVMYSQLTTGSTTTVISKIEAESTAVKVDLALDTKNNRALKSNEERIPLEEWFEESGMKTHHGLRIRTVMAAKYQRGRQSVHQYLRMTSIVNPHATIRLRVIGKEGEIVDEGEWIRTTSRLPRPVVEIKPHPHGMQFGTLQRMLKDTKERNVKSFLRKEFEKVSPLVAKKILEHADLDEKRRPSGLPVEAIQSLLAAFMAVKIQSPPVDCLSPIEDLLIKKGLEKAIDSRYAATVTRNPSVSQGNPFQVEVGLVFGGDLPSDGTVELLRFANRVPLMYQQGGCLLTKAIESIDWRRYGLEQTGGKGVPKGPAAILVHLASTNVQFTSEAKEAVSDNEEVFDELRRALFEVGRGLQSHRKRVGQREKSREKFDLINKILPEIASKSSSMLGRETPDLSPIITKIMNAVFCEEEVVWDQKEKVAKCSIKIFNYTARARAYTIIAKWPEDKSTRMTHNERGGRKEARGLWAWRLDAINPGDMAMISFSVSGLNKGDWKEAEIFYRGNGEVIGAEKIDETLLEEARKQERLQEVVEEFVEIDNSPEPEESSHGIVDSEIVKSQAWEAGEKLF